MQLQISKMTTCPPHDPPPTFGHVVMSSSSFPSGDIGRLSEEQLKRKPEDVFDIVQKLGEGSYGSVYKAIHKESKHVLAIKQVPLDTDLQEIIKEISIMQQCDSPFIVRYYGSYFRNVELLIVMEYCDGGSVSDIMRMRKRTLTEEQIATIALDALYGLEYLHARRRIHRDIKAGNILLSVSENHAKLADFGVAGQLTDTMAKRNTVIGTPFWMAPEVIQEVGYDCSADIWSLGITCIEMAEGKPPYAEIHPMRAIFMIPTKPPPSFRQPDNWSQDFIDFVSRCLIKAADSRPTATHLLQADFIKNFRRPFQALHQIIAEADEVREQKRIELEETKMIGADTARLVGGQSAENTVTRRRQHRRHHRHRHERRAKNSSRSQQNNGLSTGSSDSAVVSKEHSSSAEYPPDFERTVKLTSTLDKPTDDKDGNDADNPFLDDENYGTLRSTHNNDDGSSSSAIGTQKNFSFATVRSNSTVIIHSSSSSGSGDDGSGSDSTEGPDEDDLNGNTREGFTFVPSSYNKNLDDDDEENGTVCRHSTTEVQNLYGTTHPYRAPFMAHFEADAKQLQRNRATQPSAPVMSPMSDAGRTLVNNGNTTHRYNDADNDQHNSVNPAIDLSQNQRSVYGNNTNNTTRTRNHHDRKNHHRVAADDDTQQHHQSVAGDGGNVLSQIFAAAAGMNNGDAAGAGFDGTVLQTMPVELLEKQMRDLDVLMERDLEALRIHYLEKRKPIQDAIEEKKRAQMHF